LYIAIIITVDYNQVILEQNNDMNN